MMHKRQQFLCSLIAFAMVTLPMLALTIIHWHDVPLAPGKVIGLPDPDPWLRLTLVRDWLLSGEWYNHEMHHSNAPWAGISSPWTRPLDVALAFFAQIQPHDVDLSLRLVRAALIVPILWALLLVAGLRAAIKTVCPLANAPILAVMSSLTMWSYYNVANADHHGLLAALFIMALSGVLQPAPSTRRILFTGVLLGVQLWVAPEALLLIGAIYLWYGIVWLLDNQSDHTILPRLATTVAFTSMAAVLIERAPNAWFVPVYDSISTVYILILCSAALLAWAMRFYRPAALLRRIALSCIGGACILTLLALTYSQMLLHGPLAGLDPYIFSHFLPSIQEAKPPYRNDLFLFLSFLSQPLIALLFCLLAWKRGPAILTRRHLLQWLFFFTVTTALYLSQQRFFYYSYPVMVILLAPMLACLLAPEDPAVSGKWPARWIAAKSPDRQILYRLPLICLILLLPLLFACLSKPQGPAETSDIKTCHRIARQWTQEGVLNDMGQGKSLILLASTNLGGEIMFWTPHRIIASNYHREGEGIRYVWEASDITDDGELRHYLAKRQVDALLLCPVEDAKKGSLLQALQQGKTPPSWLTRVAMPANEEAKTAQPAVFIVHH